MSENCECDKDYQEKNSWEFGGFHNKYFGIQYQVEWPGVLMPWKYNWSNFHVLMLELEYNKSGPSFSIEAALLGFFIRIYFSLPWETEMSKHLKEIMKEHELNPDSSYMMIPMDELRKIRLGEQVSWEFEHADEKYEVKKIC